MFKTDVFKPNDIHNDRFIIINKISQGGQATTYLALDTLQMNKKVLKVSEMKSINKQKIKAQYKLISSFDHPNIVKAYSSEDKWIKGTLYLLIIMEYVEGGDLKIFIGKLEEVEIQKIYDQVKSVIQYIHASGVIHRDLTLVNILLDNKKNVKVIDFGISTQLEQDQQHIKSSILEGTRLYKPKQLIQQSIVTKQNDLWQLGITLIQLVTGKEISQLTNNKIPCFIENFPEQVFQKYKVNNEFRSIISLLLRKQYKQRKFYEDIFCIQPILQQTKLKLVGITNILLSASIKQQHIQHLLELDCSYCLLTDESATTIRLFNKLYKLDVNGNNLTDKFTYHIESLLPRLMVFKLAFNDITDESLSLITNKSLILKQLDISYTFVSSTGIMMLTKLNKLSSLAVWSGSNMLHYPERYQDIIKMGRNLDNFQNYQIKISQECIRNLCKLTLREIYINADGKDITNLILSMSKQSICIEVIGKMSSNSVDYICAMQKLEKLHLYDAFEIKQFKSKKLINCTLQYCLIDTKMIKSLSNCNKMRNLNLSYNNIGNQEVIEIANSITSLSSLNLCYNDISNQGAIAIARNMKNLIYLNLNHNKIENQGVVQIANNMENLTSLNLGHNQVGKRGALEIADNMKNLIYLNLSENYISNQIAQLIEQMMLNTLLQI